MEEPVRTGFEKCLDEFDERYRKDMCEKQKVIPVLLNFFEQYKEEIYRLSTLDKEMHKLQREISNKLEEKCNEEQKELIYQLRYCIGTESEEFVEKAFIYGFCVAQSLKEESENCKGVFL